MSMKVFSGIVCTFLVRKNFSPKHWWIFWLCCDIIINNIICKTRTSVILRCNWHHTINKTIFDVCRVNEMETKWLLQSLAYFIVAVLIFFTKFQPRSIITHHPLLRHLSRPTTAPLFWWYALMRFYIMVFILNQRFWNTPALRTTRTPRVKDGVEAITCILCAIYVPANLKGLTLSIHSRFRSSPSQHSYIWLTLGVRVARLWFRKWL